MVIFVSGSNRIDLNMEFEDHFRQPFTEKTRVKKIAVLMLALLWMGCGEDEAEDDRATTIAALTGDATAGQTTYTQVCTVCHGADGTGTASGNSLVESSYSKADTIDIILNGKGAMASYAALSDQEIANVTAYSLQFQQ